jgi:hypothetical protein
VIAFDKNVKQQDVKQVCFTSLSEMKYVKQRRNGSGAEIFRGAGDL